MPYKVAGMPHRDQLAFEEQRMASVPVTSPSEAPEPYEVEEWRGEMVEESGTCSTSEAWAAACACAWALAALGAVSASAALPAAVPSS
jgi:hypothetical protein